MLNLKVAILSKESKFDEEYFNILSLADLKTLSLPKLLNVTLA